MAISHNAVIDIELDDGTINSWKRNYAFTHVPATGDFLALWEESDDAHAPCITITSRLWMVEGFAQLKFSRLRVLGDGSIVVPDCVSPTGDLIDEKFPVEDYAALSKRFIEAGWELLPAGV